MPKFRLKDTHPTAIKLQRLFEFMDELGLYVEFATSHKVTVYDRDLQDIPYVEMEDIEDGYIYTLPVDLEYKLTIEVKNDN